MRSAISLACLVCVGSLVFACGSDGGNPGVDPLPAPDASGGGVDTGVIDWGTDGGQPAADATVVDPTIDASLDVQFPDAFFAPDSAQSIDASQSVDAGCSPPGISCTLNTATECKNGAITVTNCALQNKVCADGFGCVACVPGSGSCNGNLGSICKSDGSGYVTSDCDPALGLTCNQGICTGDCANVGQSYIGCDYYAVTLSNPALAQNVFFASVSIANTGSTTAKITVTGPAAFNQTYNVAPGAIQEVKLPWDTNLSVQYGTVLEKGGAYRIRSTEPVTVYQFNARDYQIGGSFSYTNDASILIPANAMTGNYYVAAMPDWYFSGGTHYPGNITIVATVDNTSVDFTPGSTVTAGAGVAASGKSTVTMNRGDVLEIAATKNGTLASYGTELSGALVKASQPVEVFGGSTCSNIAVGNTACDHTEEVQFPLETLRSDYFFVPPRNGAVPGNSRSFLRLVGTAANTTLTYAPSTPSGAPASLNAGQVALFEATAAFEVKSSSPIAVGEYMEGGTLFGGSALAGDPAMSMGVAKDQYRDAYTFTAPSNYAQNWTTVIAPANTAVTIDKIAVGGWVAIGLTGYSYAYVQLSNASSNHAAAGAAPFGLEVYGYGTYTSYWYPGGLNLKR